jgi:small subunit ribosomal protein S6
MNTANYETTLILTPDKSDSEVSKLIKGYTKFLKTAGAKVVHEETWGLRNFTYPINKKSTGFYYTVEYEGPTNIIADLELSLKRDEDVLRFLTIKLDKFAVDYNERRRKGLIGRDKQPKQAAVAQNEAPVEQTEKAAN